MTNYLEKDVLEIHELLKAKKIKPIDLVNEAFFKIEKNKEYNSFISLNKDNALKKAKELENLEVDNVLFGIPVALKDNIVTKDMKTTAGSLMLKDFESVYNANIVDLINENNMIIIGKLNMDEFAMGSSNRTSYFGPVLNPWNKELVSGGSSGGAACAVSKRLVPFAVGSDTGGSIRQPSAFCGVVGLKPTYGRVSRYGLIAFASSLDQIGPITKNVYENALLLNVLSGKDDRDLTSFETDEDFTSFIGKDIEGLKIAIPRFYLSEIVDKQILGKFNEIVEMLKMKNIQVDIIDLNYIKYGVSLYQIIALGEASSNLARFDGVKYGFSSNDSVDLDDFYKKNRSSFFGDEVKRRIMVGSYLLSGDNAKIYYNKALKIRKSISKEFADAFLNYDLIIGPTTTNFPYPLDEDIDDPVRSFTDDVLVNPVNMAGLPGMSLPIGFSKDNLPIGMHIIADKYNEKIIYQLASFIEKELNLSLNPGGNKDE